MASLTRGARRFTSATDYKTLSQEKIEKERVRNAYTRIVVGSVLTAMREAKLNGEIVTMEDALHKECPSLTSENIVERIEKLPPYEKEFSSCFYLLGRMLHLGDGMPKNIGEAVKWYTKAVELGNADAQFLIQNLLLPNLGDANPDPKNPEPKTNPNTNP